MSKQFRRTQSGNRRVNTKWFNMNPQPEQTLRVYLSDPNPSEADCDAWAETGKHWIDGRYTENGRNSSLWCPEPSSCLLCRRRNELGDKDGRAIPPRKRTYYYQLWLMDDSWEYDNRPTRADQAHLHEDGNMWPMIWCVQHPAHIAIQAALLEYREKTAAWSNNGAIELNANKVIYAKSFEAFDPLLGCPLEVTASRVGSARNSIEYSVNIWQPPGAEQFTYYPLPEKFHTSGECKWKIQRFRNRPALEKQVRFLEAIGVGAPSAIQQAPVAAMPPRGPEPAQTHTMPVPPKPPAPPSAIMQAPEPKPVAAPAPQPQQNNRRAIPSSLMVAPVPPPPPKPEPAPAPQAPEPPRKVSKPAKDTSRFTGEQPSASDLYKALINQGSL